MILNILLLAVGFVALIFGADKLVEGSTALAQKYKIPNIVIGLTIVAFGTSAPELVVNSIAAINHNTEVVLGNVIGSNIFNLLLILGVCALIAPLAVKNNTTWNEIPLNLLAAFIVLVAANDVLLDGHAQNVLTRSEGIVLLGFFAIFLAYNSYVAKAGHEESDVHQYDYPIWKSLLFIVIGLAGLIVGGRLIVENAVTIAASLGMSERVIGLTVISIGTSLPELATSIAAVRRKNVDIAIGNVVGSNIFNIFFILGISTVIAPVSVTEFSNMDLLLNVFAGLLLFVFVFTGKGNRIERWEGGVFLMIYLGYMVLLLSQ